MRITTLWTVVLATVVSFATPTLSQDVRITDDLMNIEYGFNGKTFDIRRNQDQNAHLTEFYTRTSRACPPFCVQPMELHEGVDTVGELELLDFLVEYVDAGNGYLIDSRTNDFYMNGTIPGAVNLSHDLFIPGDDNVFFGSIMAMLGGSKDLRGQWEFEDPANLMLFCNGPWCEQSPAAIRNLLAINYPPEKLHYYRGGMQNWLAMGFNIQMPVK